MALKNEQQEINIRITQVQQSGIHQTENLDDIVDAVIKRLTNLADELPNLPIYQLRQLLAAMTASMTADMVTRDVEMVLRLPSNAVNDAKTAISELCLQQSSGSSTLWQTQLDECLVLARIRCDYERLCGKPCFTCRRLPKAA